MKRFILLLLIIFTMFSVVSCNRRVIRPKPVVMYEFAGNTDDVVLENEYLHLRFLPVTAEIILTNKATGKEWFSNPPGASDDPLGRDPPIGCGDLGCQSAGRYDHIYG